MRRPNAPSALGRCRAPSQRAELAGGLEQAARSSARSAQVALDGDRRVPGVGALEQLAPRRAPRRRRRARGPASGVARRGELGERAREEEVARGDRQRRGPPAATTVGRPRRSVGARRARRRGRAWRSGRARPRRAARTSGAGVLGLGPRRRAPAAGAGACRPRRSSRRRARREHRRRAPAASSARRSSTRASSAGTCGAAGLRRPRSTARRSRRQAPVAPTCRAMMPPAVRIQRTSSSPARAIAAAEPSRPGEAPHRARQVGVGVGVAGEPADARARRGRTTARKNVDSGGFVRRRDLEHDDPAARAARRGAISRSPRSRSEKLRAPKPTVAAANSPSA